MTYTRIFDFFYCFLLLAILYLYFNNFPLNVDSTWILYGAKQILSGITLYTELPALNPPLIYLYSTVPVIVSTFLPFDDKTIFILFILVLISISLYLSSKILNQLYEKDSNKTRIFLYALSFILILTPIHDYGEREHLLIIFITPYILMMAYYNQIQLDKKTKIIIALFAILGFNLKPHFFLLFLVCELILILNKKTIKTILRIDFFIIALSGFFYLLFIYIFFYEYYSFAIPLALEMYTTTFNKPLWKLLDNFDIILVISSIFFYLIFTNRKFNLSIPIFIMLIISSLFIYIVQQKGWSYHRMPMYLINYIFLTHIFINLINKLWKKLFIIFFIQYILYIIFINIQSTPRYYKLEDTIKTFPEKSKIHIISVDVARGQSLLVKNQIWASRFAGLIILKKILEDKNSIKLKEYMFNSIIEDMKKYEPDFIVFATLKGEFDYYKYFSTENKTLATIYKNKYIKKEINGFTVLTKK